MLIISIVSRDEYTVYCFFFKVVRVLIRQEPTGESTKVKIFVQFENNDSASAALAMLNGRFFAGRRIEARRYPQTAFESGKLAE